jgi:energy-coupling factor transport system permease protein
MNNIALGKYIPGSSFIHKLDPRNKILIMILLMVAIFWDVGTLRFPLYIVLSIFIYILLRISGISIKTIFKSLKPMMFMMIFLFIINMFVYQEGYVLFTIPFLNFTLYLESITQTLFIIIRLALMLAVTTILTTTTKPLDMTYGLEWYMSPLKVIRFPAHEIAMTISIALRFIPTLINESNKILKAQASRGVDFNDGKFKEKVMQIVSLLVPMFVISYKKAEDLANAMEARAYIPGEDRTRIYELKYKVVDYLVYIFLLLFFAAIIVLNIRGII